MQHRSLRVQGSWMALLAVATFATGKDLPAQSSAPVWTEDERSALIGGLERTRDLLESETSGLSAEQWDFRESRDRWSIAEVVEHLGLQEDMYFREVYIVSLMPEMSEYRKRVEGKEPRILEYATDPEQGTAAWFLQPLGRWLSGEAAMNSFLRSREKMTEFVRGTKQDLRSHFTFRDYNDDLWSERDLHQLLLTTVAHTERHVNQIRRVKAHPGYPR